jgi:hypothetical protein
MSAPHFPRWSDMTRRELGREVLLAWHAAMSQPSRLRAASVPVPSGRRPGD